ncbi:MAG: FliM/FliN family flagellar motor switch protein [Sedimentisphaerales bacterium]|nr:FliM/FliN family flagellar motor switch protein [Sedimentisphaerales bacterium]
MTKENIQRLLKAVGSRPQMDDSSVEYSEMKWNEPHYFSKDQLDKLEIFVQNIAAALTEKFSAFCRTPFEVEITSTSQRCADECLTETNAQQRKDYYLSFGSGPGKEFGILEIPEQTASLWVKQLLGDSESNEEQGRELSQLEQSLLYDLASVIVKTLSVVHPKLESIPSNNIVSGQLPIKLKEAEEICRISFSVKRNGSEMKSDASFFIPCVKLEIVTGKNTYTQNESSAQDFSKVIIEHLGSTPVRITVRLACSQLGFEDMMNLQVDDIIMLDKRIDEPVELIAEGHTFGFGWPAKSEGQYAVTIAATEF